MKHKLTTYLIIVIALLISQAVYAEGTRQNIEVLLNNINLKINGQKVNKETILYNDTTYVPIRAVAEALGKNVSYDDSTQTANISDNDIIWPLSNYKDIIKGYYTYTHVITKKESTHTGIDIKAPVGTPVLAIKDGTVLLAEDEDSGYGKYVIILHLDGTVSLYAHLSEIDVAEKQEVNQRDAIAKTGTDNITGEHLHFEIRDSNGVAVNPIAYYIK